MNKTELLSTVAAFYLESHDFNGYPADDDLDKEVVVELITEGLLSLNRGDRHPNPHIKAFAPEPHQEQIEKIRQHGLMGCLYPEPLHLQKVVDRDKYSSRPFTLRLALGEPQLQYYSFDLSVLESYRNDPRYVFDVNDVEGKISVTDEQYDDPSLREHDQVLLQTFGFSYNEDTNRAVSVYLRYLDDLSPEHQRIWEAKLLDGKYLLHPDYYRMSMGEWPEGVPIFQAFVEEQHHINAMAILMGRPPLFKNEFRERARPRQFTFLLRPTAKEYGDFIHLLDKMISDNINPDFFKGEVDLEREIPRKDGKIVVERKGTIQLLDEWLDRVSFPDPKPREEMIATFKKVRKERQKPAHHIDDNRFDQAYFKQQRQIIIEAYTAMRTLRLILANHPRARSHEIPDWLYQDKIWTY